tara:strand:- start:31818 stop:32477 length:660 start_codon:yes stop_codon:yes gene_type:complete
MIGSVKETYNNEAKAKELLASKDFIPASALLIAADIVTSGSCFVWEVETLFDFLEEEGCLPEPKARDRLMAAICILLNPAFLWDAGAFMAVSQTFNGELALPELWEPLTPASLAYSIEEIDSVYKVYNNTKQLAPLYAEEPKIYMAVCCREHGFSSLPPALELCRDQYHRVYELPEEVQELVVNPVLERKLKEVSVYVDKLAQLRANLVQELKNKYVQL